MIYDFDSKSQLMSFSQGSLEIDDKRMPKKLLGLVNFKSSFAILK